MGSLGTLIRRALSVKLALYVNVSVGSTSFPAGSFVKILYLPTQSDITYLAGGRRRKGRVSAGRGGGGSAVEAEVKAAAVVAGAAAVVAGARGLPLELLGGEVEVLLDVGEREGVLAVEDEEEARLVRRHHQVVLLRLAARRELAEHRRAAERVHPAQPAVRGAACRGREERGGEEEEAAGAVRWGGPPCPRRVPRRRRQQRR